MPQLVRRHLKVQAVHHLAIMRSLFTENRCDCVLDFLTVHIPHVGAFLIAPCHYILPDALELSVGKEAHHLCFFARPQILNSFFLYKFRIQEYFLFSWHCDLLSLRRSITLKQATSYVPTVFRYVTVVLQASLGMCCYIFLESFFCKEDAYCHLERIE